MRAKPFVSSQDVYVSAANASEESKAVARKAKGASRTRKVVGEALARPKKVKAAKEVAAAPVIADFGLFRCQVCDYRMTVLPGSAKPQGGWRCPVDYTGLMFVTASI